MASVARRPIVLIVLHQEHSTAGRVGLALKATGVRLDIRRPCLGEPLPKTLADHDGAIVFGGPMCANDSAEWIRREIDWFAIPLAEEKPLLGICLGAQMLARQLGARVFSYQDNRSEIGYFPIRPTDAGDRLCAEPFPRCVYQWHSDGFDLPAGAELLATGGQDFPNQAYRYRQSCDGAAVPPGGHLPHDVQVDVTRRREAHAARRPTAARPSRRLVPARRPRGRLARGVHAGLARRSAWRNRRCVVGRLRSPRSSDSRAVQARRFPPQGSKRPLRVPPRASIPPRTLDRRPRSGPLEMGA